MRDYSDQIDEAGHALKAKIGFGMTPQMTRFLTLLLKPCRLFGLGRAKGGALARCANQNWGFVIYITFTVT
jgi:hypothetical protein